MLYAVLGLIALASIGLALYAMINKSELVAQIAALQAEIEELDAGSAAEIENLKSQMVAGNSALEKRLQEQADEASALVDGLKRDYFAIIDDLNAELTKLEKFKHIPNVIEKSRKLEAEIAAQLSDAQEHADETVLIAHKDAERIKARIAVKLYEAERRAHDLLLDASTRAAEVSKKADRDAREVITKALSSVESDTAKAREIVLEADRQARIVVTHADRQVRDIIEAAELQARQVASQARKEAKEKTQKVDDTLARASAYAFEVMEKAETLWPRNRRPSIRIV